MLRTLIVSVLVFLSAGHPSQADETALSVKRVDLSPARWSETDLATARERDFRYGVPPVLAEGKSAMVATTTFGGTSVHAGLEALRQGGSAVDAALTVALTQTVLNLGSWTSFAGVLSMVVYDAESGQVFTLDGGWNTVKNETDPAGVPPGTSAETPGRKVLVPGFMAAVQAAHDRFGKLPFEELFVPAIYFAETGFDLHEGHGSLLNSKKDVILRFPEGRALFTRRSGELYQPGDRFRQADLAATLRAVARQGADYMYRGAWAEKLVATVRETGGKMTLSDLKAYRPTWSAPVRGTFGDYEVVGLGLPSRGGVEVVEAFELLAEAQLDARRHYSEDAAALYKMIQVMRVSLLFEIAAGQEDFRTRLLGDLDVSPWGRVRDGASRALWQRIRTPDWPDRLRRAIVSLPPVRPRSTHSDVVVAMDADGNVVALLHTINTTLWGSTGLFVDGVSIADVGATQRRSLSRSGFGLRHYDTGHPYLVLRDGRPVVASASVGRALHSKAFQNVVNLLVYGMDPRASLLMPQTLGVEYKPDDSGRRPFHKERVFRDTFPPQVLEELAAQGQEVVLVDPSDRTGLGYWVGLKIDPDTGTVQASATAEGYAEGF